MLPFLSRLGTRNCLLLVIVPMIAVAIVLKAVFHFIPPPRPDMLPKADGLIETTTVEEAQAHTIMQITLPGDLLGSSVYAVGTYVEGSPALPIGSVAVTLVKNEFRFVEIIERPDTTAEAVAGSYGKTAVQDIVLGGTTGKLLSIQTRGVACVEPNERWNLPGFCEIPLLLVFQGDGMTFTLGADGSHATVGELITMAKDILGPFAPPESPTTFTFAEAGVDPLFDNEPNLAVVMAVETRDGKRFVTFDPVTVLNCRAFEDDDDETMPTECPKDPTAPGLSIADFYPISNPDLSTRTLELAADAGPYYFIDPPDVSGKILTTVGTFEPPTDPPSPTRLFHIVETDGMATKVVEHPTP